MISIRNHRTSMQYRRFGKTEQQLSVITLGGMRYKNGWSQPRDQVPQDMIDQCASITRAAFDAGINHIETAHGYGKSEHCYGIVLNDVLKVPRSSYHLMTKGSPRTAADARKVVDEQLKGLKTDRIDLYGWHGINSPNTITEICGTGGPVEELLKMQQEGIIGAVGFSTHGRMETICAAIATGLFSFVNLHYYYFFQRNWPAVALAAARDMGVFIISPNDKGGQLFNSPPLLHQLCAPLTPIQFNARFCLKTPHVQTLSFGLSELAHVNEMRGVMPASVPLSPADLAIEQALNARVLVDPVSAWEGHEFQGDPSNINVAEVLRFRKLWKCYDMGDFVRYRYNMLESKGDWFPGTFATEEALAKLDASKAPPGIDVKALLRDVHANFYKPKG